MGASSANRIWNVHLLGDYLDGTIVEPGQTFSYNKEIGPRTVERGFREGQMIWGGVLIPSIGGGVCQTATTIFNAAFEAGLPILRRTNHSFYISHYPMGRDATVSWGRPGVRLPERPEARDPHQEVSYTDATFTVTFYGTRQGRGVRRGRTAGTNYTQPELQLRGRPRRGAELDHEDRRRRARLRRHRPPEGLRARKAPARGRLLHALQAGEPDGDLRPRPHAPRRLFLPALVGVVLRVPPR